MHLTNKAIVVIYYYNHSQPRRNRQPPEFLADSSRFATMLGSQILQLSGRIRRPASAAL